MVQLDPEADDDFVKPKEKMQTNRLKAIISITISAMFFVAYGSISKYITDVKKVQVIDAVLFRAFMQIPFSAVIAKIIGTSLRIGDNKKLMMVTLRSIAATVAVITYIAALKRIPVFLTIVLEGLAPFWTILFSWMILGAKLNSLQYSGLIISFFGTILIYHSAKTQGE